MKFIASLICIVLLSCAAASDARAWGAVTHAYLVDNLGSGEDLPNAQEIYGSTLPDMFNLMYGSPYQQYLWTETHYGFRKVTSRCGGKELAAFAYGFASHNDLWGADRTAHHDGRTTPGTGYVIAKVNALAPALAARIAAVLEDAGVPDAEEIAERAAPGLAENFVETAVDLLIRRNEEPAIGYRLMIAARLRDYHIPARVFGAYVADMADEFGISVIDAGLVLLRAEAEHRDLMITYGYVFTMETSEAAAFLSRWGAQLATDLLRTETGMDVTVQPEVLESFLYDEVFPLVEPDYAAEIAATLEYLEDEMASQGFRVATALGPAEGDDVAEGSDGARDSENPDAGDGRETPDAAGFLLRQNVPNPFNPSTTIEYTLPGAAHVRLAVYDVRGREVAVLADGYQPGGEHRVTWNAAELPSGVYLCRLTAGALTTVRKMCLLR